MGLLPGLLPLGPGGQGGPLELVLQEGALHTVQPTELTPHAQGSSVSGKDVPGD